MLHVTEMARILHHDDLTGRVHGWWRWPRRHPLGEVGHACGEGVGVRSAEEPPVVLHHRAAARAVDDDRTVAGERTDDAASEAARLVEPTGVHLQRAAAVRARAREAHPDAGRAHDA